MGRQMDPLAPREPRVFRVWTLTAILVVGAVARAAVITLPGTRDVPDWKATAFIASSDFVRIYGAGGSPPEERKLLWQNIAVTTEYPPISQMEMAVVGHVYRVFDPEFRDSPLLTALIKMPGLLAEMVFVTLLLTWGRRVAGGAAEWIAASFWLNPGIWLAGPVLGYLDAQMAVPAALALLAAGDNRPRLAGFLAAVAVLTKPQAIFALPAIGALVLWSDGRSRPADAGRALMSAALVFVVALLPFFVAGTWPSWWRAVQRLGEHDLVSGTATNLWWLITWAAGSAARLSELGWMDALARDATMVRISTATALGIPNPRLIGTALTAMALAWATWRSRRGLSIAGAAVVGAWCGLAYFMLSAQVHENHAYLALPLLGIAAGIIPRLRPLYWLITAAFVLNLYLFYGLGMTIGPAIDRGSTLIDLSVVLSIGYAMLVLMLTSHVRAATRPDRRPLIADYNDAR